MHPSWYPFILRQLVAELPFLAKRIRNDHAAWDRYWRIVELEEEFAYGIVSPERLRVIKNNPEAFACFVNDWLTGERRTAYELRYALRDRFAGQLDLFKEAV